MQGACLMNFMYKYRIILFFVLAQSIIAASCGDATTMDKHKPGFVINIDESIETGRQINISEIFSSYKIIPLETREENLISSIDEIKIVDGLIYIFSQGSKSVDLYTIEGRFIRRIRSIGRGPGEYLQPAGFDVDESGDVMIYDWNTHKVFLFDKLTSNFKGIVSETPQQLRFHNFSYFNQSFVYFNCSSRDPEHLYYLWVRDSKSNLENRFIPLVSEEFQKLNIPYTQYGNFFKSDSALNIFWPFSTIVYTYRKDKVYPHIRLVSEDYVANNSDYNELLDNLSTMWEYLRKTNKVFGIKAFGDSEKYAFCSFNMGFKSYYLLYNYYSSETLCSEGSSWRNDLLEGFPLNFLTTWENKLIAFVPPSTIPRFLRNLTSNIYNIDSVISLSLIKEITKNTELGSGISNPIIILYEFK